MAAGQQWQAYQAHGYAPRRMSAPLSTGRITASLAMAAGLQWQAHHRADLQRRRQWYDSNGPKAGLQGCGSGCSSSSVPLKRLALPCCRIASCGAGTYWSSTGSSMGRLY